jgi:hypothetical protein
MRLPISAFAVSFPTTLGECTHPIWVITGDEQFKSGLEEKLQVQTNCGARVLSSHSIDSTGTCPQERRPIHKRLLTSVGDLTTLRKLVKVSDPLWIILVKE